MDPDLPLLDQPVLITRLRNQAMMLRRQGRMEEAKAVFLEAAASGDAIALDRAAWFIATCADPNVQDADQALFLAEKAVALSDRKSARILDTLAVACAAAGRFAEAIRIQREAIVLEESERDKEGYRRRLRLFESNLAYLEYDRMGNFFRDQGKFVEAEAMYRKELAMRRIMFGNDHPEVAVSLHDIAHALHAQARFADAELPAREALAIREKRLAQDERAWSTRILLAGILLAQEKEGEAAALLRACHDSLPPFAIKTTARLSIPLKETTQQLIQFYEQTGRTDQAAAWKTSLAAFE